MSFYFAYGSNLSRDQMNERCPDSRQVDIGCLRGYRLDFTYYSSGWGGGTADIVLDPKSEVWGLIYKLSTEDLQRLDSYEGCPDNYSRFQTVIKTQTHRISGVWVYTVVHKEPFVAPTRTYLQIMKNAALELQFPQTYRSYLNTIQTG